VAGERLKSVIAPTKLPELEWRSEHKVASKGLANCLKNRDSKMERRTPKCAFGRLGRLHF